jgi:hypothetical protein
MLCLLCPLRRGTQSMQNVMTDLKLWRTPLQPRRRHNGRLVKVRRGARLCV